MPIEGTYEYRRVLRNELLERRLSLQSANLVAQRLNLDPGLAHLFFQSVAAEYSGGSTPAAPSSHSAMPEYSALSEDVFKLMSDWHHFAILELT